VFPGEVGEQATMFFLDPSGTRSNSKRSARIFRRFRKIFAE
jgi:extradiol dioxygenase family protein